MSDKNIDNNENYQHSEDELMDSIYDGYAKITESEVESEVESDNQNIINKKTELLDGAEFKELKAYVLEGIQDDNFKELLYKIGHLINDDEFLFSILYAIRASHDSYLNEIADAIASNRKINESIEADYKLAAETLELREKAIDEMIQSRLNDSQNAIDEKLLKIFMQFKELAKTVDNVSKELIADSKDERTGKEKKTQQSINNKIMSIDTKVNIIFVIATIGALFSIFS